MKALTLTSISKSYNSLNALKDIEFNIEKGELFGMLGPDGAGKTTLLRIIATLLIPDTGKAQVFQYDTVKDYKQIRNLIGYMPGQFSLYHDLSVEENLNFFATVFGTSLKKNYELIKDIYIHLEPYKTRLAGRLSGGMKQKLALCCALIHRPGFLVLDEPTTGVDAVSRKEFWEMLHKIKEQGISMIVSTPYMDEAGKCDRVALMQSGRILVNGRPSEIPGIMKKSLFSVNPGVQVYETLQKLRTFSWCYSAWLFGRELHLILRNDASTEVFHKDMKALGYEYQSVIAGIEDVFIDLMTLAS